MVSVIVPAYNCERTILSTLFSALRQTEKSLEIIVVDDGSTDQTYELVNQLALTEPKIQLYRNLQNCGVSQTRNNGCRYARGSYIAFLDSDDQWEPDKLEKQLFALEDSNADLSYTSYYIESETDITPYKIPPTISYRELLKENVIGCSTVVLRSKIMKTHAFDPTYFHEDYALWLTLLREGYKVIGIEEMLVHYRTGGRSFDKLRAAKNRWIIYRQQEKLLFFTSLYYLSAYFSSGAKKYLFSNRVEKTKESKQIGRQQESDVDGTK
jgi:teichuronic acid biosynthesis glycosyltransferase TuaG